MADRYWVGGTGNWSDTAHWAATSGGAGGQTVPGTGDNVIFDTLSSATAYTVTIDATSNCFSFTLGDPLTGHVTLAGSSALSVFASFSIVALTVWTYTGVITFKATSGTQTITTNGVQPTSSIIFNGVGGTWQLADGLDLSSDAVRDITLTNGTFDSNGKAVKTRQFSSNNTNTRVLTMGASAWTLTDAWTINAAGTGLTVTANTASIVMQGANFVGGSKTYYDLQMTIIDPQTLSGSNTFHNLTILNTIAAGSDAAITFNGDTTVSNAFTSTGNSGGNSNFLCSSVVGTARTITAATASLTNTLFQDITGAGAATWSGTSIGDCGGNTNITATSPVTRYWVSFSGTTTYNDTLSWSTSSGGSSGASVPLPQDTAIIDALSITSAGRTINIDHTHASAINMSAVLNSPILAFNAGPVGGTTIYGGLLVPNGITYSGTGYLAFGGRSSVNFNPGNQTVTNSIRIVCPSGTVTLLTNNLVSSNAITLSNGTFNANGKNVTCTTFTSTSALTRTLTMGSGTWTLNSTGTVFAQTSTGLTFSGASSTIVISENSITSKTFQGLGFTYGTLTVSGDNVIIQGSNTFTTLNVNNAGLATGLKITAGTTQTTTNFTTNGSVGSLAKLLTQTGGSPATLSTSSPLISVDYMSIKDSTVTQTNTWYAGANSTNVSGNTNWIFTAAPSTGTGRAGTHVSIGIRL